MGFPIGILAGAFLTLAALHLDVAADQRMTWFGGTLIFIEGTH